MTTVLLITLGINFIFKLILYLFILNKIFQSKTNNWQVNILLRIEILLDKEDD